VIYSAIKIAIKPSGKSLIVKVAGFFQHAQRIVSKNAEVIPL
jgi:hypothetical protein